MKTKPRGGAIWLCWILAGALVEAWTLFDSVPNNTLSHWVSHAVTQHEWIGIALPIIFVITLGHWCCKRWIWQPPTWEDEDLKL